jgi:SAM-dependent methyltransferase
MKRTIEKLHQERREKEAAFQNKLDELKKELPQSPFPAEASLEERIRSLESKVQASKKLGRKIKEAVRPPGREETARDTEQKAFNQDVLAALRDIKELFGREIRRQADNLSALHDLFSMSADLADAKDKEWDALGSNHVGMIFKSMEWRVDGLAAAYEDVQILMKKFLLLEDKLTRLLALLDEKKMPTPADVAGILEPLRDWRYTGFENRFRGREEAVQAQQEDYAGYFKKGGKVLDLGCGRGEFLELLKKNGVEAEGLDLNGLMIDACLDKGLNCRRGDILEGLAARADASLDGIFSSQVIEHLPPASIQRLIQLAFAKLGPSGVLVLETVNPLSLFALVNIFFLDMSHITPVHPLAAKFLLETAGFKDVTVRYSGPLERERLQNLPGADGVASVLNRNIDALNDLLFAPPNYAVMGTKR